MKWAASSVFPSIMVETECQEDYINSRKAIISSHLGVSCYTVQFLWEDYKIGFKLRTLSTAPIKNKVGKSKSL